LGASPSIFGLRHWRRRGGGASIPGPPSSTPPRRPSNARVGRNPGRQSPPHMCIKQTVIQWMGRTSVSPPLRYAPHLMSSPKTSQQPPTCSRGAGRSLGPVTYVDHAWRAATPVPAPGVRYADSPSLPSARATARCFHRPEIIETEGGVNENNLPPTMKEKNDIARPQRAYQQKGQEVWPSQCRKGMSRHRGRI